MKLAHQKIILFFSLLVGTTFLHPNEGRADLDPDEREFLTAFLGLTAKEASIHFQELDLPADSLQTRYGESKRSAPTTIYLNRKLLSLEDDQGLRLKCTRVHEAIHLYFMRAHPRIDEEWIEEGFATLGEYLYALGRFGKLKTFQFFLPIVNEAVIHPEESLSEFYGRPSDYGRSFLFFLFLYETFSQSEFSQTFFREKDTGWSGLTNSLFNSYAFSLTPHAWKKRETLVSQFYWSLIQKRNMLSTTLRDRFSQLLTVYNGNAPLTAYSYTSSSGLDLTSSESVIELKANSHHYFTTAPECRVDFKHLTPQTRVYRIQKGPQNLKAKLMDAEVLSASSGFSSGENEGDSFLVIQLDSEPSEVRITCEKKR
jgi:hypothetical protein